MQMLYFLLDIILHLNEHIGTLITTLGVWTYVTLFIIIMLETGCVFTTFLPGDSLLFATGLSIAGLSGSSGFNLNINAVTITLICAAVVGDTINYWTGRLIGARLFSHDARFLKTSHLDKTHTYFEKYGGRSILIARFLPFIRTFMPFVAGMGKMNYIKFVVLGIIAACVWILSITHIAYFFGSNEWVKNNFGLILLAIIFLSILAAGFGFIKSYMIKLKKMHQEKKNSKRNYDFSSK